MEIFINELSLHGQYPSQETFTQSVVQFVEVFSFVQDKVKGGELFKDDLFITQKALLQETFLQSFERIKDVPLKIAFRSIIFNKLNPRDWRSERLHLSAVLYTSETCLVQDKFVTDTSVAEIAERKLNNSDKKYLLINFNQSQFTNCSTFEVIKEEKEVIELDCIETKDALEKWLDIPIEPLDIFLRNTTRFSRTNLIFQGKTIFKETQTGYYWYLDNFHKNEFEVFNSDGIHIGIANMDGIIDFKSAKKGREIDL